MIEVEEEEWVFVRHPTEAEMEERTTLLQSEVSAEQRPLKLVFLEPAKHWTDAIPLGNGSLGAMVWGGVATETIQLNHDTLWTGVPHNYTDSQAPAILAKVRKLVDSGKYSEASLAAFDLSGNPSEVYQPLGEIKLDFGNSHEVFSGYERELDLDTATARVKYLLGDVEFTREYFCSYPHQVLVIKISSNKSSSVSFTVSLDSKLHHHSGVNGANQIIMNGHCPGKRKPPKTNESNDPKGIQFCAILHLFTSTDVGTVKVLDDRKLRVEGSDWAVLLMVASSSFDGPFVKPMDSQKDPISASGAIIDFIRDMSFSQLYAYHLVDYQELFHRVILQLSKSVNVHLRDQIHVSHQTCPQNIPPSIHRIHENETSNLMTTINKGLVSTAERVNSFKVDEDPSLVELLFHYGRYLLISSSRPGTQVANLQGIWSQHLEPPWDAAPHLNINLQMNYWPSLPCNLFECQEPLFDYISSLAVNGSKTARVNYGTHGWVTHQVSDIWAKTSPDRGDPLWALWPMGGAWLCTHLWEHYAFSMDKDFLEKRAYPLMEGCVSFLLDWLIEGQGGYLETNPSTSPEHYFIAPDGKTASVSYSSTMDMSIIKEVFRDILSAAEVLKKSDSSLVNRVNVAMQRLPPTRIARDGSIMEWAQDFQDPDMHHRHLSHLFGLFPGHTITMEKSPDLCKAADFSLYKRGDIGPGWSTTWKMALWARLHNSHHAYKMITQLMDLVDPDHEADFEGGLYSNLFTAHPPFQIDANFGFAAAVAEMLVQSTGTDLYLLPALPRDKWPTGCVRGLKARGGATVSICWKAGEMEEADVWSKNQNLTARVHYDGMASTVKLSRGNAYVFNRHLKCLRVRTLG